ncbi:MAG: hypothetical protein SFU99_01110 [Saprospiraceae bacterium]|nr:hypothetical protein [Saprospiraceae bacterium]
MPYIYKTLYVPTAEVKAKSAFSATIPEVNGDQLARDVQATLLEMESEGYKLHSISPVTNSKTYYGSFAYSYTDGMLLVFQKSE